MYSKVLGDNLHLGSVNAPVAASINLDAISANIQTYIDNVVETKVRDLVANTVNASCQGAAQAITSDVMQNIQANSQINVMFHAVRTSAIHLGNKAVIVFDSVEKNIGGGYNVQTGKFTAPYKGLYFITTRVTTTPGNHMHIALVQNGKITSLAWAADASAVIAETIQLNIGDKVWVWHNRNTQEYVYPNYTIFAGTLLRLM
ncbi:Hypothetical predicted protein [Mytilus galloprovincialis]|nr:Hypothetical predicted protein [Mytilus galloprovincialis]